MSSTSVYPALNRTIRENDAKAPEKESGKALLNAEQLLNQETQWQTTVLRFCGLIGHNRHPGRFLTGKKSLSNG
ncbi:MAG: SDR family NAD(P)-dependent oxidoreductase, partial [Flavobacteriales bacterium]